MGAVINKYGHEEISDYAKPCHDLQVAQDEIYVALEQNKDPAAARVALNKATAALIELESAIVNVERRQVQERARRVGP